MTKVFFLAVCLLLLSLPAFAKGWVVDKTNSRLTFTGTQGSSAFQGSFKDFTPNIDFDPDHVEAGKITVAVNIASVTAGSSERDSYLPQTDWFDTKSFPQARFVSTSIQKTGDHAYSAQGNLTIKNITKPVTLPFTLVQEGDHWRAQGKLALNRTDYHVGERDWANETYVKFPVDVLIDISAKPQ